MESKIFFLGISLIIGCSQSSKMSRQLPPAAAPLIADLHHLKKPLLPALCNGHLSETFSPTN